MNEINFKKKSKEINTCLLGATVQNKNAGIHTGLTTVKKNINFIFWCCKCHYISHRQVDLSLNYNDYYVGEGRSISNSFKSLEMNRLVTHTNAVKTIFRYRQCSHIMIQNIALLS